MGRAWFVGRERLSLRTELASWAGARDSNEVAILPAESRSAARTAGRTAARSAARPTERLKGIVPQPFQPYKPARCRAGTVEERDLPAERRTVTS